MIGDDDTITGMLLAGCGNVDEARNSNFLVVDASTRHSPLLARAPGRTDRRLHGPLSGRARKRVLMVWGQAVTGQEALHRQDGGLGQSQALALGRGWPWCIG
jgi:hypothetical protein